MIGYGPERENFALELTYNYGVDAYEFGNDLQYIALHCDNAVEKALVAGFAVEQGGNGAPIVHGPDQYKYKIIPLVPGRSEAFTVVAIRVSSLQRSRGN
jgi:lactoylglutathione lyase